MNEIRNFLQLSENIYTSGQPSRQQLARLNTYGIRTVLNLALTTSDYAVADEAVIVAAQGIRYLHLPVVWEQPTREDFAVFCRLLASVEHQPTLVHCALNMRVSAFMFLYRTIEKGMDAPLAAADLAKIWDPADQWYRFLNAVLADHGMEPMDFGDTAAQ